MEVVKRKDEDRIYMQLPLKGYCDASTSGMGGLLES